MVAHFSRNGRFSKFLPVKVSHPLLKEKTLFRLHYVKVHDRAAAKNQYGLFEWVGRGKVWRTEFEQHTKVWACFTAAGPRACSSSNHDLLFL